MMDRVALAPAFKKLSPVGNPGTEQVISGVSAMREKLRPLWNSH